MKCFSINPELSYLKNTRNTNTAELPCLHRSVTDLRFPLWAETQVTSRKDDTAVCQSRFLYQQTAPFQKGRLLQASLRLLFQISFHTKTAVFVMFQKETSKCLNYFFILFKIHMSETATLKAFKYLHVHTYTHTHTHTLTQMEIFKLIR